MKTPVIITSAESQEARKAIGLSQAKFCKHHGITRCYLSDWENGKRMMSDDELSEIRLAYESEGYEFPEREMAPAEEFNGLDQEVGPDCRIIDGIVYPVGNDGSAEAIANELSAYDELIEELLADETEAVLNEGLLFDDDSQIQEMAERVRQMAFVMARAYALIKRLQGFPLLSVVLGDDEKPELNGNTTLGAMSAVIHNARDFAAELKEESDAA